MESVEIACHCVAQMGQCCFPIGHEAMLADIFGCHIWELLLSGVFPGERLPCSTQQPEGQRGAVRTELRLSSWFLLQLLSPLQEFLVPCQMPPGRATSELSSGMIWKLCTEAAMVRSPVLSSVAVGMRMTVNVIEGVLAQRRLEYTD